MRIHMGFQCALKRVGRAVEERRRRGIFDKTAMVRLRRADENGIIPIVGEMAINSYDR